VFDDALQLAPLFAIVRSCVANGLIHWADENTADSHSEVDYYYDRIRLVDSRRTSSRSAFLSTKVQGIHTSRTPSPRSKRVKFLAELHIDRYIDRSVALTPAHPVLLPVFLTWNHDNSRSKNPALPP
jgi:hypothetical protein